jgi:hypothetical protein
MAAARFWQLMPVERNRERRDMSKQIKLSNMMVFIEFVAGSGLALFFHRVLNYKEVGYILFGVGILLSLATYLLREDMEKIRGELLETYNNAHEIPFAIAQLADAECQGKAHEIMAAARRTIQLLQQGFIPLEETEFYLEAARYVEQAGSQVKAVDPVTAGWDNRGSLLNFYQTNVRALKRGVKITRIFVITRGELAQPEIQKVILPQFRDGINVRVAYRDELHTAGALNGRDTPSSYNFAIHDDRAVTDVFGQTGKYYGIKTTQPFEVEKYLHLFQLIEHSSHAVSVEDGAIVCSSQVQNVA